MIRFQRLRTLPLAMILRMQCRSFVYLGATTFFFVACSDGGENVRAPSDASATDAVSAADAGIDVESGPGSGGMDAAPPMLGSGVAGKACGMDSDCPTGGTCAKQIDLAGSLGMLAGVSSMQTPAPGGYCTASCTSDGACGSGASCIGTFSAFGMSRPGTCEKTCTQDSDCRSGYRCAGFPTDDFLDAGDVVPADADGATTVAPPMGTPVAPGCAPIPTTAMLPANGAGKGCSADGDCGAGGTCLTLLPGGFGPPTNFPGGYCTGGCLSDSNCGAGGRCLQPTVGQGGGQCHQGCKADADCRTGYRCRDEGQGFRACLPGDPKVPDGQVGHACTVTDGGMSPDCGSQCMSDLTGSAAVFTGVERPAPGGYCSSNCLDDSDCGGGVCLGALSFPGGASETGVCFETCAAAADCARAGYACSAYSPPFAGFLGAVGTGDAAVDGGAAGPTVCQPAASATPDASADGSNGNDGG